jgi:hypothetical protein
MLVTIAVVTNKYIDMLRDFDSKLAYIQQVALRESQSVWQVIPKWLANIML